MLHRNLPSPSALAEAYQVIEFRSQVATPDSFLLDLTGCRVLHFTWNGDGDEEQVRTFTLG